MSLSSNTLIQKSLLLPGGGMRGQECHTRVCAPYLRPKGQDPLFMPPKQGTALLHEGVPSPSPQAEGLGWLAQGS